MLRFAPSPNGRLHLGHALSALANERMARALGLPLTVRMEDIDRSRARTAHEAAILEDLAWLGIEWTPPMRRQSEHFGEYTDALDRLKGLGLVYPSFSTRREIAQFCKGAGLPRAPDGAPIFPGDDAVLGAVEVARRRAGDAPAAWRLRMGAAVAACGELSIDVTDADGVGLGQRPLAPLAWGDVVLARKDIPTSYHLSVVVDDAVQGISHVVRGLDLFESSAVHQVLQGLLGLPSPYYHHHRLVLGDDGRKLSKSNGAQSLKTLRDGGLTPDDVRARLTPPAPVKETASATDPW